jgi:crotonobetainyl-CoA:carnitine CoA-transferase CaiB-like acyl-CoA transferase
MIEGRTGYPDDEPLRLGHTLPDGVGGLAGALAALRGLRERAKTGTGGWFDISQLEVYCALSGEDLLWASSSGQPLARIGNRSRWGALQGVFRCRGADEWIAIRLAARADVDRLADLVGRAFAEAVLSPDDDVWESLIGDYTAGFDKHELAGRLQDAGLEAFAVLTPPELAADRHLRQRSFFVEVPFDGRLVRLPGSPLHGQDLVDPCGPPPDFGEHTVEVEAWLGLGEAGGGGFGVL